MGAKYALMSFSIQGCQGFRGFGLQLGLSINNPILKELFMGDKIIDF